jgi:RNA polymerase sigma-70 factor (ECF subfamily)
MCWPAVLAAIAGENAAERSLAGPVDTTTHAQLDRARQVGRDMGLRSRYDPVDSSARASFATTHWSLVLAACGHATPEAREALAALRETYWYPLYAFVRRKGYKHDLAQDLVQGFFLRLIEKDDLRAVAPAKGRFRSYLMAACTHYLANQRDHDRALKRGGRPPISLDAAEAERRYTLEPAHSLTAERLYLRRWATTLLDTALDRLRREMSNDGKASLFEELKSSLLADDAAESYRQLGLRIGRSEGTARVIAHRMRSRFRAILHEEVGRTVADPREVEQEIRELFVAMSD